MRNDECSAPEAELDRAREEVAGRLRSRGIALTDTERPDELVRLLDTVERFESIVQRKGGDLMLDEPVGDKPVREPDNRAFVLPRRLDDESVGQYIERITRAADRAEAEPPVS